MMARPSGGAVTLVRSAVTMESVIRLFLQPVAGLADGENVPWSGRVPLEFAAQLRDVCIHGATEHRGAVRPHLGEQLHARRYGSTPLQQRQQQVELFRSEPDRAAVAHHSAGGGDDFDYA